MARFLLILAVLTSTAVSRTSGVFLPLDVLVDKTHSLPEQYSPGEMAEAREALEILIQILELETGENVVVVQSSFRSFAYQTFVHQFWCNDYRTTCSDFSAEPGHSEHQLGTTFDLAIRGLSLTNRGNKTLWEAIEGNAHLWGFVISYPYKECEERPGNNYYSPSCGVEYKWEPWHIRYIGVELAEEIFAAGYLDPTSSVIPQNFYRVYQQKADR